MKCPFTLATRALVRPLLAMARVYSVVVQVSRDSTEQDLLKAYKKVILKTHPDKGGDAEDFKKLQAAKENWDNLRKTKSARPGRRWPSTSEPGLTVVLAAHERGKAEKEFRIRGLEQDHGTLL